MYPDAKLLIDGQWRDSSLGTRIAVIDPATAEKLGTVETAGPDDLVDAVFAAKRGFDLWRKISALERSEILRKAAWLLRERIEETAAVLTAEQGKPLREASAEIKGAAEHLEWAAEEGRRAYGRIIPARRSGVRQSVLREPVGLVAAFTPWNFPIGIAAAKVGSALAAGCSVILKPSEETPAAPIALGRALQDAGLPPGVLNIVYGDPRMISGFLLNERAIRKVTFTGSTAVGRELAELAARQLKRTTMELGGHAPVLIFDDANWKAAADILVERKYRNAGQVCGSPTRILVQAPVFDRFVARFVSRAAEIKVGPGQEPDTIMGPMANERRVAAMNELVSDFASCGAEIVLGGSRKNSPGFFFEPTVVINAPLTSRGMSEEPFGPIAMLSRFEDESEAIAEANRLEYGLAAYAYTSSARRSFLVASEVEAGILSINHDGRGLPETPMGGVKDSGHGAEGGIEGLDAFLTTKFVSEISLDPS
jgi:succinate-semialdehyde dehydrogenase / glutarate-semialdehyde dehydrogenase